MKREHYIVDGYNFINAWTYLSAMMNDLEQARDKLTELMAEFSAYYHYDVTVVFDAFMTEHEKSCETAGRFLRVAYTDKGETADSYIERLAYESVRTGREVYVVTSDYAEQTVILGAGAYRVSSREFIKTLKKMRRQIAEECADKRAFSNRRELGSRINAEIAEKLDIMRKKR